MIMAKPGFQEPSNGQTIYLLYRYEKPIAATLHYPTVVALMGLGEVDDFKEIEWIT